MHIVRVRRPRMTYANAMSTFAVVLALSTTGAYAAGKIGAKDIQKNAVRSSHIAKNNVKTADIKGKAVTKAKLAPNARPATVIRYTYGAHDFSAQAGFSMTLPAPASQYAISDWDVQLVYSGSVIEVIYDYKSGEGPLVQPWAGKIHVSIYGPHYGKADGIRIVQTIPTVSKKAAKAGRPTSVE